MSDLVRCAAPPSRARCTGRAVHARARLPAALPRLLPRCERRRMRIVTAAAAPEGGEPRGDGKKMPYLRSMLNVQLSKDEVQRLSKSMASMGLDSASKVRAFLLKRSAVQAAYIFLDIGINAGASIAAFATFRALLETEQLPAAVRLPLSGLAAFGGGWFLTTVASDVLLLGMTTLVTLRYGLAADAFLDVVRSGAGGDATLAGGRLMDAPRAAASALAAAGALDAAMRTLQERVAGAAPGAAPADTAKNLASYFTLRSAEEERGFKPEALALTERDALGVARVFEQYDANGDGVIDANELRALMIEVSGATVSVDQAREALRTLDADGDGQLSFEEFAKWWATVQQAKQEQRESGAPAAATGAAAEAAPTAAASDAGAAPQDGRPGAAQ